MSGKGAKIHLDGRYKNNATDIRIDKNLTSIGKDLKTIYECQQVTSLDSNGTFTFQYSFKLNNSENTNNNLLPYFTTHILH